MLKPIAAVVVATLLSQGIPTENALRGAVGQWVDAHQQSVVGELVELLAIPNVAADRANIRRNAEHLRAMLAARGFAAELLETAGNPLVYGELQVPGATPTLAVLQPLRRPAGGPEGLEQADPFTPVLRTGARRSRRRGDRRTPKSIAKFEPEWRLYARSASDDKAPIVALCAALDAFKSSGLASPTRTSASSSTARRRRARRASCRRSQSIATSCAPTSMVILDGPMHSSGRPTVVYGARGIVTLNLTVFGPKAGVHSGNYGNWVPNPAQRLAALLASMKGDDGRVLVAGFNDGILPLTAEEQAMLDAVPDDSAEMLKTFGVAAPSKAFPAAAGRAAVPDAQRARPRQRPRRRRRADDHSRPRDRGDRHPAGQGNAARRSRREAARPRPRAGLPPRRRRA